VDHPAISVEHLLHLERNAGWNRELDQFSQGFSIGEKRLSNVVPAETTALVSLETILTMKVEVIIGALQLGAALFIEAVSEIVTHRSRGSLQSACAAWKTSEVEGEQTVAFAVGPLPLYNGRFRCCFEFTVLAEGFFPTFQDLL
jgi:hypothetical protein